MYQLIQRTLRVSAMTLMLVVLLVGMAESQGPQVVTLQIDGMTCGACVKDVKAALAKVPGVQTVEITVGTKWLVFSDYTDARARVAFDPQQANTELLTTAVEEASTALSAYKAQVLTANVTESK